MSRSKPRLQAVVDEIKKLGAEGFAVAGDLTKGSDCQSAVEEAASLMGGLDVLINNGSCCSDLGVEHYGMADEIEFLENYKTHVASAVIMMQAALPHLIKSRGTIVNMSSMMSQTNKTIQMAYNASKTMEDAVTRNFAMLHAKNGVRINSVNPGYVLTDVYDRLARDENKTRAAMEAMTAVQHPLGRNARVEEVASVVLFLASQAASFITGVSIPVDGGGLLTSWFNLDLQPRIAENGEDVVFGPDHTAPNGASNGNGTDKEDYPAVESGAPSVTAAATAPAQAVQMPRRMLGMKLRARPASSGMARIPLRSNMCLSARGVLAFGA